MTASILHKRLADGRTGSMYGGGVRLQPLQNTLVFSVKARDRQSRPNRARPA